MFRIATPFRTRFNRPNFKFNTLNKQPRRLFVSIPTQKSSSWSKLLLAIAAGALATFWTWQSSSAQEEEKNETENNNNEEENKEDDKIIEEEEEKHFDYVIIGGGVAGFTTAIELSINGAKNILVVSDENYPMPYIKTPLSKELWNELELTDSLNYVNASGNTKSIFYPSPEMLESNGITIYRGISATRISSSKRKILLSNDKSISYGKCVIATGVRPKQLTADHPESPYLMYFSKLDDFLALDHITTDDKVKHITILGGGLLGSELASSLSNRISKSKSNLQIAHVNEGSGPMSKYLPIYLVNQIEEDLKKDGVNVYNNKKICHIQEGSDNKSQLEIYFKGGEKLKTDCIVVAAGTVPNVDLAKNSYLEIDSENGGIVANSELMIKTDLYTVGDVASYWDLERRVRIEHHWNALQSARYVARRILGKTNADYTLSSIFWGTLKENRYRAYGEVNTKYETVGVFVKGSDSQLEDYEMDKNYKKGVIYYLNKESKIVGLVLWNMNEKEEDAAKVLSLPRRFENRQDLTRVIEFEEQSVLDELRNEQMAIKAEEVEKLFEIEIDYKK